MSDDFLSPYRELRRRSRRPDDGRFIAEGEYLVRRVLESRFQVESIVVSERKAETFRGLATAETRVHVVTEDAIHELVGFEFHRGALACAHRDREGSIDDLSRRFDEEGDHPRLLVVLPSTFEDENLGSILRTCAAFGVDGVLLGPGGADPLSRRALRVSMGGALIVPTYRLTDSARDLQNLREAGFDLCATVLSSDAGYLRAAQRERLQALVFGNEADGLSAEIVACCTRTVTMPMHPEVDSLNVGVAAGIAIHQFTSWPVPK